MDETAEIPVTRDAILGGRVTLIQPERGHRAGHDAVLLAAAVPAAAGERVLDLGSGVGAAAFALARRVPLGFLTLVEIDPILARLAEANAALNGVGDRTRVIIMDARARGSMRERSGLLLGQIDRVMTNPPFHDAARHRGSPQPARRLAHQAGDDLLAGFLRTAVSVLRPGGSLTMIHRADQPEALLASLRGRFGGVTLRPVHPRPSSPAIRLIVNAVKGSRAPVTILPGLILQDPAGRSTPEAEAILREGAAL